MFGSLRQELRSKSTAGLRREWRDQNVREILLEDLPQCLEMLFPSPDGKVERKRLKLVAGLLVGEQTAFLDPWVAHICA